jgi:hypothetical protein
MNRFKLKISGCSIVLIFSFFIVAQVHGQNYIRHLVKNLIEIGYPIKKEDIIALDKIGMRFDTKNRITVIEKILSDREFIHSQKDADYFVKTEIVCDALRLLDEHDLPLVNSLIDNLNNQNGWEKREKTLLAYIAAKRDIRYETNVKYLIDALPQNSGDLESMAKGEVSWAILDVCNYLSFLSDLFVLKGDADAFSALIRYTSKSYGYPAEYLSHMFVDMFLRRPEAFISQLAAKDDKTIDSVINSLIFGIWNNRVREKVKEVLKKDLSLPDEKSRLTIALLSERLSEKNQTD